MPEAATKTVKVLKNGYYLKGKGVLPEGSIPPKDVDVPAKYLKEIPAPDKSKDETTFSVYNALKREAIEKKKDF